MIVTDRGVYRPGSTAFVKAIVRQVDGDALPPLPSFPVRVRITDPTGEQALLERGFTNAAGALAVEFPTSKSATIGRYSIIVEPWFGDRVVLAQETIQVAEFEPPRFAVDVSATADAKQLKGTVNGRYLFGAAMEGATASWTLRREPAELPRGPLADRGLRFRDDGDDTDEWYEGEEPARDTDDWMRVGQGQLDAAGELALVQPIELPKDGGPQSFVLEAEVADESHRTIANRSAVTVFDAERYAGVRLVDRWQAPDAAVPIELGVVDRTGAAIAGATVEATLERVTWERTRRPGPGGAMHVQWHPVRTEVARCTAETATVPVSCELVPREAGDYVVSAWVDGRRGGADDVWVWNRSGASPVQPGHELELVADKAKHAPGETATVEFPNPFGEALAIVTIEGGGELRTLTQRVHGTKGSIPVEVAAGDAPRMHTTVSLLPIGAKGEAAMQWKFGALRLPVALDDARLTVAVKSDRAAYEPGTRAEVTVEVLRGGQPVENADIALAIVDEGVLRLTDFHAIDPVEALRPAGGLSLRITDQRDLLAALALRSHIAGDGPSEGEQSLVSTRKNFVETALWRPDLVTDAEGRATVSLDLPDNLTRFRMMAVVLDERGRGGVVEDGFEVRKPLMVIPAIPRFAVLGDTFEAAALVHNEGDTAVTATVALGDETREVQIAAHGRQRVPFEVTASVAGKQTYVFEVRDGDGKVRDRVEVPLPVHAPGIDERPRLAASFVGAQDVIVEVPDDALFVGDDDELVVTTGLTMWPELGARLEFLVDYPHGCVEQTTSSTLPLLAARELLPRLGFTRYSKAQIDERIAAGVARLASMKTSGGGLAYWPGDFEPNAYGTAYALRALVRARAAGILVPSGLIEGMQSNLATEITGSSAAPGAIEVRTAIALALAEADALPPSLADTLYDGRKTVGPFGLATLALVLSTLPGQDERVAEILDLMEATLDERGLPRKKQDFDDFAYYGSGARSRAQIALALERLRPTSALLPVLVEAIIADTESYTTQATAFGLIALTERLRNLEIEDATFAATLDGEPIWADPIETVKLGGGAMRWTIPLAELRGRSVRLRVTATGERAASLLVEAKWRRPFSSAQTLQATAAKHGPDLYRLYTDPTGKPIDLAAIAPGDVVRVGLLAKMPVESVERDRIGYVAMTDSIPAGFEPIEPDLATVAQTPELSPDHPLADMMGWGGAEASHSELHDDRVDLYFDRVWGDWVAASYLIRATTPGDFIAAPARVELMYEPDSLGYSDTSKITVKP
ncbi:MAG TPA: alpha-2-macroglobulin family protein [Nannocystaceae bacterium]|nr:alpha-2-macroglobulin family protein [Nannocystaceae bacterium]